MSDPDPVTSLPATSRTRPVQPVPPPGVDIPSDPGSVQAELDAWGARLDSATEEYTRLASDLADAQAALEKAQARSRMTLASKPPAWMRGRRPTKDEADAIVAFETEDEADRYRALKAELDACKRVISTCETQIERWRTAAASARVETTHYRP